MHHFSKLKPLYVGTRSSPLAIQQAKLVEEKIKAKGRMVMMVYIITKGDLGIEKPLSGMESTGVFVKALEDDLRKRNIDLAVHSGKDIPVDLAPDFWLPACLPRAPVWDVWLSPKDLPENTTQGFRVGTSSVRRSASLRCKYPWLTPVPIRGNIDTRIRKLLAGECDALVIAAAGLIRLGWLSLTKDDQPNLKLDPKLGDGKELYVQILKPPDFIPAAAQGAIVLECLKGHPDSDFFASLDDLATHRAVTLEREVLYRLGAGCHLPFGVLAVPKETGYEDSAVYNLCVALYAPDGSKVIREEASGPWDSDLVDRVISLIKSHQDYSYFKEISYDT